MIYYHYLKGGNVLVSNLNDSVKSHYSTCLEKNIKFFSTVFDMQIRHGLIKNDGEELYLLSTEKVKSSRLFKEQQKVHLETFRKIPQMNKQYRDNIIKQTNRLIHNLPTYNAHISQSIYSLISQEDFSQIKKNHRAVIRDKISKKGDKTALAILTILKNSNLIKTEFSIYEKIFGGEFNPSIQSHSVHKLIKLIANIYWSDFLDRDVNIIIEPCKHRVLVDFESISAVFVHIFENALKYVKLDSDLKIAFKDESNGMLKVSFDMVSLKIETYEKDKVFEDGYSGEVPKKLDLDGNGVGMFVIKQLLDANDIKFELTLDNDISKRESVKKVPFQNNTFSMYFKKGHFIN